MCDPPAQSLAIWARRAGKELGGPSERTLDSLFSRLYLIGSLFATLFLLNMITETWRPSFRSWVWSRRSTLSSATSAHAVSAAANDGCVYKCPTTFFRGKLICTASLFITLQRVMIAVELISGPSVMFLDGKCVTELRAPSFGR